MSVARVVVDVALDRQFDYEVPVALQGGVVIGARVRVPFGRREALGYVVALPERSEHHGLKPVLGLADDVPLLTPELVEVGRWMASYYCAPLERAIATLLPGAVRKKGAKAKEQLFVAEASGKGQASVQAVIVSEKQERVLNAIKEGGRFLAELIDELGISTAPVRALEKKGLVTIRSEGQARDPFRGRTVLPTQPLELMDEQASALELIKGIIGRSDRTDLGSLASRPSPLAAQQHVVLLYGVTGSGKTEVYLQAIQHVRDQGRGAIVLVPEISLTPQTVERFRGRFGDGIAVLHSHLSEGERHDEWHRIRAGKAPIVIGARSAVFAPVPELGLIVVDEEHEPSYKQEDVPRYNARDVAVMRGHMQGCTVVLGSATPSLESWLNTRRGKYALATLPHRADHRQFPHMRIVDMRLGGRKGKGPGILSPDLMEAVHRRLERGEQTILFLNRRGYATSLVCPQCGYVANCDQCSVAYTYHRHDDRLHCHICGESCAVPSRCPGCGDPSFRQAGVGTQRVETVVKTCFPQANVRRIDADVTTRRDSYEEILGDFRTGKIDILIGTQMIAKGLHFPNVTLVGVVNADLSLHMPDFRAGERTFQLLAQVAGRAGRGDVAGEVIVQTFTPSQTSIQAARRVDFEGFADQELAFREELIYPPYGHLVCLLVRGRSEQKVAFFAGALAKRLRETLPEGVLGGEASPAPLAKARGMHRYHVMLRARSTRVMLGPVREAIVALKPPHGVSVSVDVDAVSLL